MLTCKVRGCTQIQIGRWTFTNLNRCDDAHKGYWGNMEPWKRWFPNRLFYVKKRIGFIWFIFFGIEVIKD